MDPDVYETEVAYARESLGPVAVETAFDDYGQAKQLFEGVKDVWIVFLNQGNHQPLLENGALLTVYASIWDAICGRQHEFPVSSGNKAQLRNPKGG